MNAVDTLVLIPSGASFIPEDTDRYEGCVFVLGAEADTIIKKLVINDPAMPEYIKIEEPKT